MKRSNFRDLLLAYAPTDKDEIVFKQQILDFINSHDDCFERSQEKGHITGSCWILSKDGSKALLLHHMKLDRWLQLGGHCDGDPDVLGVAIKEAQEESGINGIEAASLEIFDIDVHLIPENPKDKAHYHYDIRFLLQVTSDEQLVSNRESKELRWIGASRNELPTDNRSVVRMFDKWVNMSA